MISLYKGTDWWDKGHQDYSQDSALKEMDPVKIMHALREFLEQNDEFLGPQIQPLALEQMQRDVESLRLAENRPGASSAWVAEFHPAELSQMDAVFRLPKVNGSGSAGIASVELSKPELIRSGGIAYPLPGAPISMNGYMRPAFTPFGLNEVDGAAYSQLRSSRHQPPAATAKGKARLIELPDANWEQHFAEIDSAGRHDLDDEANAAIETELDKLDDSVLRGEPDGDDNDFYEEFTNTFRNLHVHGLAEIPDIPINGLGNAWDNIDHAFPETMRDPQLGDYLFEENNPFLASKDPFNEGLKILDEGGNLSLASLAFEAAVQLYPQHVDAWSHLGTTQAQNEKESAAIRAFEQTLKFDHQNLSSLMGLAISYTNEGYDTNAYRTLERWLSVKYPQVISPDAVTPVSELGFADRHQLHEKVIDFFISAARLSPQGDAMDPDVQVGLGVLFYGAEEHSKAIDCFEAALASTEEGTVNHPTQAHLLWNRLGATLANSGRSEEAIVAYEQALRLKPNFVRARYNLGVSCINIGCLKEAAQHLLTALNLHRVAEQEGIRRVREATGETQSQDPPAYPMIEMNQSTNLIDTLRRLFSTMGRKDLVQKVGVGMDVEAFSREYGF